MNGCYDSAIERDQMWRELYDHFFSGGVGEFLFNFRQVPVRGQTIGSRALIALNKKQIRIRFPARAAHSA